MFTKGPLGLIIPLAVTAAYLAVSGRLNRFFRYWSWRTWSVLIVLVAAWLTAVYAEGGAGFLREFVENQLVDRTFDATRHVQPFYYYLLTIWYILAPWSLLIIGINLASLRHSVVKSGIQTFFLTASFAIFVVLSCVGSKMQIYMLPAVPFMVYSAAMFTPRYHGSKWIRTSIAIPALLILLALPVLIWAASRFPSIDYLNNGLFYAAATVLSMSGGNVLYHLYNKAQPENLAQIIRRMAGGIGLAVFVAAWALPAASSDLGYGKLCEEAMKVSDATHIGSVHAWRLDHAANMDAYLGKQIIVEDDRSVPQLAGKGAPFILLTRKEDAKSLNAKDVHVVGAFAVVVCNQK